MSNIEALEKRITELEAEIAKLKVAHPAHVIHSHYHYGPTSYGPPNYLPRYPYYPQIVCGGQGGSIG